MFQKCFLHRFKENEIQFIIFVYSNNNNNIINFNSKKWDTNNSDFNNTSNIEISNKLDYKRKISQNGSEKRRFFSNSQITKNISKNNFLIINQEHQEIIEQIIWEIILNLLKILLK